MGLLTARQPDDRGKRVPIISMYRRRPPVELRGVFPENDWKRIRTFLHQRSATAWPIVLLVVWLIGIGVISAVISLQFGLTSKNDRVVVALVRNGLIASGTIAIAWLQWMLSARRVRAELVYRDRCASCGYSLAELEPAADGCTVCPECGAAWRLKPRT